MKRSKNVHRPRFRKGLPMATTLSMTVGMSACSPPSNHEDASIYRDAGECERAYPDQLDLCDQVFNSAKVDHLATAPRFDGQAQCEADFGVGNCEPAPENTAAVDSAAVDSAAVDTDAVDSLADAQQGEPGNTNQASHGGGWFMPMMMGYMMGNMMSGRSVRQTPVYSSSARNSPIKDKIVTGKGDVVGKRGDRSVRVPPSAFNKPSAPARVTRTGGFGAMAAKKAQASSRRSTASRSSSRSYGG